MASSSRHRAESPDELVHREALCVRMMRSRETAAVAELVKQVFEQQVAGDFEPEGVAEFLGYATPDVLAKRQTEGSWTLVASLGQEIVGMIEVRDGNHVSLFFVSRHYQGRGIGSALWQAVLTRCQRECPEHTQITVNSSLFAQPVYEHLGFRATGPRTCVHGIVFLPMSYVISQR